MNRRILWREKIRTICKPFTRRYTDPDAPYDGYEEEEDTEERARTVPLSKKS